MPLKPVSNYFNTAATGLLLPKYVKAATAFLDDMVVNASEANEKWYSHFLPDLRHAAAELLDADVNEIALVPNFSYALSALVHALTPGMRVLVLHEDYPSVVDPFRLNGFDVHRLKSEHKIHFNVEDIMVQCLARKTEVLAISHVQWLTGFKLDLNALGKFCREKGILLIVDATQSLGAIPVSLRESGADVIIASNYKWMNAGLGTGIMCARRDFLERFPAKIRGNHSRMLAGEKWTDEASILGYEPGHLNTPGLLMLAQSIEDKLHTGTDQIEQHNLRLTQHFIEEMVNEKTSVMGPESMQGRSSIVAVRGGERLYEYLTQKGFVLSFRNGVVRISFHYHNTKEEVNALIHCMNHYTPTSN